MVIVTYVSSLDPYIPQLDVLATFDTLIQAQAEIIRLWPESKLSTGELRDKRILARYHVGSGDFVDILEVIHGTLTLPPQSE